MLYCLTFAPSYPQPIHLPFLHLTKRLGVQKNWKTRLLEDPCSMTGVGVVVFLTIFKIASFEEVKWGDATFLKTIWSRSYR